MREVVERLGERLKRVSLQAPESVLVREIGDEHAPLVTPELLERWLADPARAPGRQLSSPWPERIEVHSVEEADDGVCRVDGEVVYLTSQELARGGVAAREAVTLSVVDNGEWRVSAYRTDPTTSLDSPSPPGDAAETLRRYYDAIAARDYRNAYALWGDGGAASGQSFEAFAAGFSKTAGVEVEIGEPGRVEGAAGTHYVLIPVIVRASTTDGVEQRFEGTYTLRRSVVEGASAEQRAWHIHSAEIVRTDGTR